MSLGSLIIEALVILCLIAINGFFSSAEIAIISSKRSVIEKLAKDGNHSAVLVTRMKDEPERFLATVQIGVTVVATLASVIGGVTASEFLEPVFLSIRSKPVQHLAEFLAVGTVVILISYVTLILGELVPKSLALRYAERMACFTAKPIDLLSRMSRYPVRLLTLSSGAVLKAFGVKGMEKKVFISEEEIKYFIKEGKATGIFEETEAALLHGVFEFADTTVREVMVPKHKFSAIDVDMAPQEVLKFISYSGFSRYPVYRENRENVIGVLFNKDVFRAMERGAPFTVKDLIRPPYFVPNSVMISRLMREMQRRKVHMAIVVDEHGEVDGLVTIEDILEEIVGEIEDEYDVEKGGLVERLRDGSMLIDASASLRDLVDVGIVIDEETEEYHTLAGFMLSRLQRIPRGGEFVIYKNMRLTVVDVEQNRIVKVKVEPLQTAKRVAV